MTRKRLVRFLGVILFVAFLPGLTMAQAPEGAPQRSIKGPDVIWVEDSSLSDLPGDIPTVRVLHSTADELVLDVQIAGLTTSDVQQDGTVYRRLQLPYSGTTTEVGKPELPTFGRFLALPQGAQVEVEVLDAVSETIGDVLVYPAQEPQPDGPALQEEPPFVIDEDFYAQDTLYPGRVATVDEVKSLRGCQVTVVRLYPFQYNSARRELTTYSHLRVRLRFVGAEGPFVNERYRVPSFENLYRRLLLNYEQLGTSQPKPAPESATGAEFLIITHPDFQVAANALATWRNGQGIDTEVRTTNETGSTAAEIRTYIQDAYDNWSPPPEFVLFLGDAEFVPTNYQTIHPYHSTLIGTDLYYATVDGADYYPDIHTGRISVDTAAEAQKAINDIIDYDRNPVSDAAFYQNVSMAAYFQDHYYPSDPPPDGYEDRRFVLTSEEIRDFLLTQGYTVERIYNAEPSVDPTNYNNGSYANGEPLPAELLRANGFAWDGDAADITAAVNAGRFILNHRDHGATWCWGDPHYAVSDVQALTNGNKLPVVFSMNCQTGWFDNETDDSSDGTSFTAIHFSEAWQRNPNGGAVGVIGATRVSYSGYNDWMTEGFYDAIWPDFLTYNDPGFSLPEYRIGVVLNYGKLAMETLWGGSSSTNQIEFEMFHYFGDPVLMINTGAGLVYQNHTIDDDDSGGSSGNDNGRVDAGETIEMPVTLFNAGQEEVTNVVASLSTADTYVTVTDDQASYGDIAVGGIATSATPYVFSVDLACPDDHWITFVLDIIGTIDVGGTLETWSATFQVEVHNEPQIEVAPTSYDETLDLGEVVTRTLTISNTGTAPLTFEISERAGGGTPAGGPLVINVPPAKPVAVGEAALHQIEGQEPGRGYRYTIEGQRLWAVNDINVLLVYADYYPTQLKAFLEGYPDIGTVATWYAASSGSIPALSDLLPYDVVIAWNNMAWDDPDLIGDVLADYHDAGGNVILTVDAWSAGTFRTGGRFIDEEYTPFLSLGGAVFNDVTLGWYNASHPLMEGVSTSAAHFHNQVELSTAAVPVAEWNDGMPFVAIKAKGDHEAVGINAYYGSGNVSWTTDAPLIIHNTIAYLLVEDVPWLSEDPISGTVSADGSLPVDVVFDATGLALGDYTADLAIYNNDPDENPVTVPVVMHVTINTPPNTPSNPSPADGATDQDINVDLSWTGGDPDAVDTVTYDVYFEADDSTPDNLICNDVSTPACDPGALDYGTHYYWYVVATDNHGASTTGDVWNFYTGPEPNNPPNTPSNPSPADGATGQDINVDLGWTGGDPDAGDTVTYDVYFEADDSTPDDLICNDVSTAACDPGMLGYSTHYYWYVVATDNYSASTKGDTWDFTTGPAPAPPAITSITPNSGNNNEVVYITDLAGSGFQSGATVRLIKTGQADIVAISPVVVVSTSITCDFDLRGASPGQWIVRVTNPDTQSAELYDGFTVKGLVYLPLTLRNP